MVDGKMKPPPYPFTAPIVQFHTKVYHSNIDGDTGCIQGCWRVLTGSSEWRPNLSAARIVKQIVSGVYLSTHSTDCPLRSDVAELYNTNRLQHDENARAWTKKYAIPGHTQHEDVEENGGNLKEEQQKEQKK
jgi:ubiquitin-protein ligase